MSIWSYVLAAVGVTGFIFVGKKKRFGWTINIFAQLLWVTYAVVTQQWGFIISACIYGAIFTRNWWLWRPKEKEVAQS